MKGPYGAPPASAGPASELNLALVRDRRKKEIRPPLAVHGAALERAGYVQPCRNMRAELKHLQLHSCLRDDERYVRNARICDALWFARLP